MGSRATSGALFLQLILPAYQTRYLLGCVPAILRLLSLALEQLARQGGVVRFGAFLAAAALAGLWLTTTAQVYTNRRYQHHGHREASAYVTATRTRDDVFTGDPAWQVIPFNYYLDGSDRFIAPPLADPHATQQWLRLAQERGSRGVWVATLDGYRSSLQPLVEAVADPADEEKRFHGVRLRYYLFRPVE